jgi:CDGSH-type Zn-finger protein
MTDIPHIAQKAPYPVDLEAGKTYFWCACGQSKSQPFCDGSHKGTSFTPMKFTAEDSKTAYLCGCKQTKHAPFCDGTHKSL